MDPIKAQSKEKNPCWKVLKYNKPQMNRTTPILKDLNNRVIVTMYDKQALVRAHTFLTPPILQGNHYLPSPRSAYLLVNL